MTFEFLLGMSETFLCSLSAVQVKSVLLVALQRLMLLVRTLTQLERKLFLLIIFYIMVLPYLLEY
jgi:hypothetical protein